MASNGNDPTTGAPRFPATDAPDLGVDEEILADYAAFRGTRLYGTNAEMEAHDSNGYARDGELWVNTTDGITYRYSSGWKEWESDWATYTPSSFSVTLGSGGDADFRYRFVGGDMEIEFLIVFGTSSTWSSVTFTIPAGYSFGAGYASYGHFGTGEANVDGAGTQVSPLRVARIGVSTDTLMLLRSNVASTYPIEDNVTMTQPVTFVVNGSLSGHARFRVA